MVPKIDCVYCKHYHASFDMDGDPIGFCLSYGGIEVLDSSIAKNCRGFWTECVFHSDKYPMSMQEAIMQIDFSELRSKIPYGLNSFYRGLPIIFYLRVRKNNREVIR